MLTIIKENFRLDFYTILIVKLMQPQCQCQSKPNFFIVWTQNAKISIIFYEIFLEKKTTPLFLHLKSVFSMTQWEFLKFNIHLSQVHSLTRYYLHTQVFVALSALRFSLGLSINDVTLLYWWIGFVTLL